MRLLTYSVMFYMSLALIWWSVLLYKNNQELMQVKTEKLSPDLPDYEAKVHEIYQFHQRKARMILGEGMVFGAMLIVGLFLIQRFFQKEIESAQKQKNFLLSITHELKSPIASVNLITETLQKRDLDKPKRDSLLSGILSESKRLEKLINNLLLSAKLQTQYKYNFEKNDLHALTETQVNRYNVMYPELKLIYSGSPGIIVDTDKESFESVISNLLENAIKYAGTKHPIRVNVFSSGKTAVLEVIDEGPGIPKNEIGKIFDPFYRVGNEETRNNKGTGLGLYIVGRIVKAHKGKIEMNDNLPSGTICKISLPLNENV